MRTTNTLIIGGGQAGLALSHCLTTLGRDHLVLERVAWPSAGAASDGIRPALDADWMTAYRGLLRGPRRIS
jgi:cation diffusion facilitator CzcD-associated flavoprotein CzcO